MFTTGTATQRATGLWTRPDQFATAAIMEGRRLHATLVARRQGQRDWEMLLTPPEGDETPRLLSTHLHRAADYLLRPAPDAAHLEGQRWVLEVPSYAHAVAQRLEEVRDKLEARHLVPVRREALEAEAQSLGATLGSILARELLEQRRGED